MTTAKKSYLDEKALKRLENYLQSPVETTRLVLMASGKLDGKRRLVKLLKRDALVYAIPPASWRMKVRLRYRQFPACLDRNG